MVRAHELLPGDRIVGTHLVVASGPTYSEYHLGGDVERQRYIYTLTDGRTLTYGGDSRAHVLRAEGLTN